MNLNQRWRRSAGSAGSPWLGAPFGIYATADGHMAIAMTSLRLLGELLDLPELAEYDDARRACEHRDTIKPLIQERLRTDSTAAWMARLLERDVWCAEVQDFEDPDARPAGGA